MGHVASGCLSTKRIEEIDLIDLLGRDPVEPNNELLHTNIRNKV